MNSRSFKKDVTDREVEILMRPHLEILLRNVVPRRTAEGLNSERAETATNKESKKKEQESNRKNEELTLEEKEFLESILQKPNLSVTGRADFLGLSSYKNDQVKKALLRKGLIEEFTLNLGYETRGIVKLLELTQKGYKALGKNPPLGRAFQCSSEHWFWQRGSEAFYLSQGFEAKVEWSLNGKRADVGFIKDGQMYAVEVGLTPGNEVVNVVKDLEAGFDHVLVACKNSNVKKAVEKRLQQVLAEEQWKKVKLILLSDFSFVKEIVGKTKS